MAATGFRNVIIAASAYVEGNSFIGNTASIKLPDLTMRMTDDEQMGLPGTIERFFGIEKLESELIFNTIDVDLLSQFGSHDVRNKDYSVRYSTQNNNGDVKYGVAEFSGRARSVERPPITTSEDIVTTSLMISCISYQETFDGTLVYDIDIEKGILIVNGEDHWAGLFEGL